ncbi:MAG: hypothetical protein HPY75_15300, partial [Actinobacteria bacterium]|nr:hypothetical protein [Actinomycetota bacterium]
MARLEKKRIACAFLSVLLACGLANAFFIEKGGAGVAREYTWTDMRGPGNGDALALAYATERQELYRGTNRGVWAFKRSDVKWEELGGTVSGFVVTSLAWSGSMLYAGTREHGVWRYDPGTGKWTDTGGGVSGFSVFSLAWDGDHLYAGFDSHGVWRYDPGTGKWTDTGGGVSG